MLYNTQTKHSNWAIAQGFAVRSAERGSGGANRTPADLYRVTHEENRRVRHLPVIKYPAVAQPERLGVNTKEAFCTLDNEYGWIFYFLDLPYCRQGHLR
jgi:hypothetical protein